MARIVKRCDCGEDRWKACPHPWLVRYRTTGGRSSRQREQSFGTDLPEAENFALKVEHDKRAYVFIDPRAGRAVFSTAREAAVAPLVRDISPALLWHFGEAGWNFLGYEYAPGRHADYTPDSPDLDRLVQLMDALSQSSGERAPFRSRALSGDLAGAHALSFGASASAAVGAPLSSRKPPDWCCHSLA